MHNYYRTFGGAAPEADAAVAAAAGAGGDFEPVNVGLVAIVAALHPAF